MTFFPKTNAGSQVDFVIRNLVEKNNEYKEADVRRALLFMIALLGSHEQRKMSYQTSESIEQEACLE